MNVIDKELQTIFHKHLGIYMCEEIKSKKLFGNEINCPIRELALILYDIENHFEILIDEDELLQGYFDTYNHILELLQRKLSEKNA